MHDHTSRDVLLHKVASCWDADAGLRFYELASNSDHSYEALSEMVVELVCASLGGSRRILDVGCGLGFLSSALTEKGNSVLGIDLSPRSIAHASRAFGHKADFAVADVAALERQHEQQYDAVVANMVMHNYPYLETFLVGCRRVLSRDGIFVATIADPVTYLAKQDLPYRREASSFQFSLRHACCSGDHAKVPYFHRQIDTYTTALAGSGFRNLTIVRRPQTPASGRRNDVVRFMATV
jgi:SAM-dependent methyltransferase